MPPTLSPTDAAIWLSGSILMVLCFAGIVLVCLISAIQGWKYSPFVTIIFLGMTAAFAVMTVLVFKELLSDMSVYKIIIQGQKPIMITPLQL